MQKVEKGDLKYIDYRKRLNLIKMLAAFSVVIGVFILGFILNGNRNNIFTIISIVLVLPAAKMAVAYFVVLPHKTAEQEFTEKVLKNADGLGVCFDCIFSNSKKPIAAQAVVITDTVICAYTNEENADVKLFENSLQEFMKNDKLHINATLYKDEKAFLNRVHNLSVNFDSEDEKLAEKIEWNKNSLLAMCI